MICLILVWNVQGRGGGKRWRGSWGMRRWYVCEEKGEQSKSERETERKCVFGPAAQQICLFCTIWHQTQQTAECLLLLVVPH